jgi:hypothetical protein
MKSVLYNDALTSPKVSFILLDWSCRESFHSLDYLARQDVPRSDYEVIWIEYYDRRAPEIDRRVAAAQAKTEPPPVDDWIIMEMPSNVYYHKHLMYNVGIARARGEIVVICDSDAMFEPSFVRTVCDAFAADPQIVLHIDEVRSGCRDFYPFNYPSFQAVREKETLNWRDGKTTGLWDQADPLHSRNYGACLCARRQDLIAIGGADEHLDYLGHICGPYELTFRLMNYGRREVWHQTHFIYHTWHPGTDGDNNYIGPSDGRGMSTTALAVRTSGRVMPLRENKAVRLERTQNELDRARRTDALIDPEYKHIWTKEAVAKSSNFALFTLAKNVPKLLGEFRAFNIVSFGGKIWAAPHYLGKVDFQDHMLRRDPRIRCAATIEAAIALVEQSEFDARRLFGEDAGYDVVDCNGEWLAIPRTVDIEDWHDRALLASRGVIRASNRDELADASEARSHRRRALGADDGAPVVTAGAPEELSLAAVLAKLDETGVNMQALVKRMDRIGAIAEMALLQTADLRQGEQGGRQDGAVVWSLRHPRKALVLALKSIGFSRPTQEPPPTTVAARPEKISADMQAPFERMERIGAIAEAALHKVADRRQFAESRVPPTPPQHEGRVVSSLRRPGRALQRALRWN